MIPLFTASLTVDYFQEVDATKSKGTPSMKYGSATAGIVCGDMLCSEVNGKPGNLFVSGGKSVEKQEMSKHNMPPYPDQPSIHPNLLAGYDYSNPPAVHKVTDGVWVAVGYDLANSIMIEGDDGIIIVDTMSTYEDAKEVLAEFRKITDKPVVAIIYTHGHLDHVHGTGAFLEEGEDIEIYAHESHVDFYINENSVLGPIAAQRSAFASGAFLPDEGPDRYHYGILAPMFPGTIAYAPPTQIFSDELEVEISGVKMKMVYVAGESSDQIYVWLPDKKVLLIGDNIYAIIPNIYTLRGSVYRDPMNYVNALDKMIPLEAEYLVPNHVKPVIGKENVRDVLVSTRDATQYIYDQTIRGMNQGHTADELANMITLPEHLDNHPWLTKNRNQVSSHVKQVYYGNLGWYEGDPAFLTPIPLKERSQKIVEGFGGIENTISAIREAIDDGDYKWAAELSTYAIHSDNDNEEAKLLKAHALRVLGQRSDSMDIRHWSLTEARVLEGKITIVPGAFTQTSPEQMAELPIEKLLGFLPTKLDPQKAAGVDTILGITYSDIGMDFTLHVRNSILAVTDGAPDNSDMSITLDSETHKLIVGGHLNILDAIESGQVELEGDVHNLVNFMNLFDNLSVHTHGIG
jgi:alkyl sulfatase BDS1-like metallo-beta-lactamase superfamily hydrolase